MFDDRVVDETQFSEIVGQIYDCVLEPLRWVETLARIASLMRSAASSVIIHDDYDLRGGRIFEYGADQKYLRLFFDRHAMADLRPLAEQERGMGVPTTLETLAEDQPGSRKFFTDFVRPLGFNDVIAIQLLRSGRRIGWLSTARSGIQQPYGERERRLMSVLSPHLCQAFALSDAIDLATLTSDRLELTVDTLSAGVFLTDHGGRIVHMNRSAQRQINTGSALQMINRRLTATNRAADATLARALTAKVSTDAASSGVMALPDGAGGGYLASVLPLDRGARRELMAPFRASAAVFVQDPLAAPRTEGEAFARLYGLTGAELRVLLSLAPGLAVKEAARALGLGEPTVKTHLQRIYRKTGIGRQSELVRLLLAHTPPLRRR